MRRLLIALALAFVLLFLVLPLAVVFHGAFAKGWATFATALAEPDTRHALWLTLLVTAITVPVNVIFGVAFAWLVTRFRFRGRALLITLLDIPFAVSPVIAGLLYLLLYGMNSPVGAWFAAHNLQLMFAVPGIVLVTVFVTCPFVARELIPFMQQHGAAEEEAAVQPLATVAAHHPADHPLAAALWRGADQRARGGRIWRGFRRLRQHPGRNQHPAA